MLFITIFFMGLQLGATSCAISCLPVMTPILLANSEGKNKSVVILFQYFGGKILAYTFIGTISFFGGSIFKTLLTPIYFSKIAGIFLLFLGIFLLYRSLSSSNTCASNCHSSLKYGYFGIGFFSSFSFCLPLSTLIATSAVASSFVTSIFLGISFGLGVVIVPFLFFYFFIFKITSEILINLQKYTRTIQIFSSSIIIFIGIMVFFEILKL